MGDDVSPTVRPHHPGRAPAAAAAASFVLGAAFVPSTEWGWTLACSALSLATAALFASRGKLLPGQIFVLLGFLFLGASSHGVVRRRVEHQPLVDLYESMGSATGKLPARVEGELEEEPEQRVDSTVMKLTAERVEFGGFGYESRGGLRVSVRGDPRFRDWLDTLHSGDRVRLWAFLRHPRGFMNPGSFDVQSYYRRKGWCLSGTVKSALLVERVQAAPWWLSLGSRLRGFVRGRIEASYERVAQHRTEVPGVVLALLVGDRSLIPAWALGLYQAAGTFHVIAISGAHVGLLAWLIYTVLRKLGVDEKPALGFLILILPLYASLCGARPSVVRAVLMCLGVSGARLLSLDSPGINGLSLSALICLAWHPLDLADPGFQLSFTAAACILLFSGPLARFLDPWLGRISGWVGISLAAQVGVVPILAWHFMRLTPVAIVANLVAIPLAGAIMVTGVVLAFVAPSPWLGDAMAWIVWVMVKALTVSSQLAVSLPGGSIRVSPPGVWWVVFYLIALLAAGLGRGRWGKPMTVVLLLLVVWLIVPSLSPTPVSPIRLTAFDVGHGDALLLELPDGQKVLVDGGGSYSRSFDIGERVLVPALLHQGVRALDAIVVTHGDRDHVGGLPAVVETLRVKEIWEGRPAWEQKAYRELRSKARARGVPIERLEKGDERFLGEVRFQVISPGPALQVGSTRDNENCLVLLITYGRARLLLTGDTGARTEKELLRWGRLPRVDVLKVGHHGSRGSTGPAFLEAVSPRYAVVSTGGGRLVGLPSGRVLRRLRERGITTLRTDLDGAITINLDSYGDLNVETYRTTK